MQSSFFLGLILLMSASTFANPITDDRDLSPLRAKREHTLAGNLFKPDRIEDGSATPGLSVKFVRLVKGVETPVEGLSILSYRSDDQGMITSKKCSDPTLSGTIALRSSRYSVSPGAAEYRLFLDVKCGVSQKVIFEEKSDNAQPIAIWQMAMKAEKKLSKEVGLKFWTKPITFVWPAQGDYYAAGRVNLTLGYQWDVVAHEMGHAIYDQAKIGVFGGGEHYIDRCYTDAMALSEGWASFFSAWVNLDLADPDARFEYMVPRRAPIQIENVPADVCGLPTNEWRVTAFLWDLIDTHDDGETLETAFSKLWKDTAGAGASSLSTLKVRLIQKGWDADTLRTIWKLNFPADSANF